jgi:hypothetical protein
MLPFPGNVSFGLLGGGVMDDPTANIIIAIIGGVTTITATWITTRAKTRSDHQPRPQNKRRTQTPPPATPPPSDPPPDKLEKRSSRIGKVLLWVLYLITAFFSVGVLSLLDPDSPREGGIASLALAASFLAAALFIKSRLR